MIKNMGFKKPFPLIVMPNKMNTAHNINWDVMQRQAQKDFDRFGKKRLTHH